MNPRTGLAAAALALAASALLGGQASASSPSAPAGQPFLCQEFDTNVASALQGSAVTWTFDSDCVMTDPIPIRVRVYENGRVIFEKVYTRTDDLGRQWGVVDLSDRAPCQWSDVMVEAAYDDGGAFSDYSATQTRVWYDPDDHCGA